MKKTIITALIAIVAFTANAQTKKTEPTPTPVQTLPAAQKLPPVDTTLCNTALTIVQNSFSYIMEMQATLKTTAGVDVSKTAEPRLQELRALAQFFAAKKKELTEQLKQSPTTNK